MESCRQRGDKRRLLPINPIQIIIIIINPPKSLKKNPKLNVCITRIQAEAVKTHYACVGAKMAAIINVKRVTTTEIKLQKNENKTDEIHMKIV